MAVMFVNVCLLFVFIIADNSKFYATTHIKAAYQLVIKCNVKYGTNLVRFCTRGAIIRPVLGCHQLGGDPGT